jgi:hypothetical protein
MPRCDVVLTWQTLPVILNLPTRTADQIQHDGKTAKWQVEEEVPRMAGKAAKRQEDQTTGGRGDQRELSATVKVTLHLKVGTMQRLGIESAMRRMSQSAIAEEVLAAHLSRWELPMIPDSMQREAG